MTVSRTVLLLILLAISWTRIAQAQALQADPVVHWVGSWAMAPQAVAQNPAAPPFNRAPAIAHATVREIIVPTLSGSLLRLRFSNRFGSYAVPIGRVTVGLSRPHAGVEPGSLRIVRFNGDEAVSIPPRGAIVSDAIQLPVRAGESLAVSIYVSGAVKPMTWHKIASQVNFISTPGDHAMDEAGASFARRTTAYLWLDRLDVEADTPAASAIVAIGDSITDGMRSTLDANKRWPDDLAKRLRSVGLDDLAVLNAGISGNRLLHDSPCYGQSLVQRFARDALDQPGANVVIVLIGINDINFGYVAPHAGLDCDMPHTKVTASEMIAGYRELIAQAHNRGIAIYGGTITPASLPPVREAIRQKVNAWMRHSKVFDGVIDFDAALRDPLHPVRLLPRFDSGDHVHPSDAGYAAMADAIPLDALAAVTRPSFASPDHLPTRAPVR